MKRTKVQRVRRKLVILEPTLYSKEFAWQQLQNDYTNSCMMAEDIGWFQIAGSFCFQTFIARSLVTAHYNERWITEPWTSLTANPDYLRFRAVKTTLGTNLPSLAGNLWRPIKDWTFFHLPSLRVVLLLLRNLEHYFRTGRVFLNAVDYCFHR